jgi:hypothetical protein
MKYNTTDTAYINLIKSKFRVAYNFFEKHHKAFTDSEWEQIAGELSEISDAFTIALVIACIDEIEEHLKLRNNQKKSRFLMCEKIELTEAN